MDELLERNKNLNRGFRKLQVWRGAVELYVFAEGFWSVAPGCGDISEGMVWISVKRKVER